MKFQPVYRLRSVLRAVLLTSAMVCSAWGWAQEPVDINTADAQTLTQLKNVGEKKAQAIVEYRESHGKFASVEDLVNVKGIGQDTLDENRVNLIASE